MTAENWWTYDQLAAVVDVSTLVLESKSGTVYANPTRNYFKKETKLRPKTALTGEQWHQLGLAPNTELVVFGSPYGIDKGRKFNSSKCALANFDVTTLTLLEKKETTMLVNLKDSYAYQYAPYNPVRVLCLDRNNSSYPVVVVDELGQVSYHTLHGQCNVSYAKGLVPLEVSKKDKAYHHWVNTVTGCDANLKEAFFAGWEAKK